MSTPKRPKRPADFMQRAYQVFQEAIGEAPPPPEPAAKPKPAPKPEAKAGAGKIVVAIPEGWTVTVSGDQIVMEAPKKV